MNWSANWISGWSRMCWSVCGSILLILRNGGRNLRIVLVVADVASRSRRLVLLGRVWRRRFRGLTRHSGTELPRGLRLEVLRRLAKRRADDRTRAWIAGFCACRFLLPNKLIVRRGEARLLVCLGDAGRGLWKGLQVGRLVEKLRIRLAGGRAVAGRL